MDKKYFISKDSNGIIHWLGIKEENNYTQIKITNTDNKELYEKELEIINDATGNELFEKLDNNEVIVVDQRFFTENLGEKFKTVTEAEEPLKEKTISKKLVAAAVAAGLLIGSTSSLALSEKAQAKANTWFGKKDIETEETVEEVEEQEEPLNLENKSLDALIDMLEDEERKEAFNKIIDTQDYFNEVAAPTVKQGNKQLFFTFDETTSAYLYANAKVLSSDKLASFFGQSKIMVLNEETGEYEQMDKDLVSAKYLSFCLNLSYYYQLGATEKSGVDQLFENEKEAEFFRNFEAKILEYNKKHNKATAAEIRKELEEIFMSGNVDSLTNKYSGATSIIGTAIVPYLYLNEVIDKDMYKSLVNINETITCQYIYTQIEKIVNCKTEENGKEEIIERIAELQNLLTKDLDRNISLEESLKGYRKSDLESTVLASTPGFASSKTVTKHYHTTTNDRGKAVKAAGEKATSEAEKQANEKAGINQNNQDENDYWDGYTDGYNKAYDNVWAGGSGNVAVPSGNAKYVQGYKDGIAKGKESASADLKKAAEDKKNHQSKNHEETVEETFVPETNNNSNQNNNNNNSNSNNNSNNNNNNSSSSSQSAPREEIVEETFVYENDSASAQKVVKVESHESNQKVEVTHESESVVRVRINP